MVELNSLQHGDLWWVNDKISVPLGDVVLREDGTYSLDQTSDATCELRPGSAIVFVSFSSEEDNAIVVLADGILGWVFRDEVDQLD